MHIECWVVFFKILWLLNLWVSGIFFKGKWTCSIYSSVPLGRQGPKTKTSGCAIARAFIFTRFDLLNRNTSKVTQKIPVPSGCWACHFLPRGKKVTGPTYWGTGISFVTFDVLRFKRWKLMKRSCSHASTSRYVGTLLTDRHGAINRTSLFSLEKKIPET